MKKAVLTSLHHLTRAQYGTSPDAPFPLLATADPHRVSGVDIVNVVPVFTWAIVFMIVVVFVKKLIATKVPVCAW